jgi:hypothetical protein
VTALLMKVQLQTNGTAHTPLNFITFGAFPRTVGFGGPSGLVIFGSFHPACEAALYLRIANHNQSAVLFFAGSIGVCPLLRQAAPRGRRRRSQSAAVSKKLLLPRFVPHCPALPRSYHHARPRYPSIHTLQTSPPHCEGLRCVPATPFPLVSCSCCRRSRCSRWSLCSNFFSGCNCRLPAPNCGPRFWPRSFG